MKFKSGDLVVANNKKAFKGQEWLATRPWTVKECNSFVLRLRGQSRSYKTEDFHHATALEIMLWRMKGDDH